MERRVPTKGFVVEDLLGHWCLAAATSGYFVHHPRVDEAQFTMEDPGSRLLRSRVRYSDGRRVRTFRGRVPRGQGHRGLRWWGSRAHLVAAR